MTDIPILIPVKEYSTRCNKKNYALLPYAADYIQGLDASNRTAVIADSQDLTILAASLGLHAYLEKRYSNQDELRSCYNYAKQNSIQYFFLCPITQPFKREKLMQQMAEVFEKEMEQRDFITTISKVTDRNLFYVEDFWNGYRFIHDMPNRKGIQCATQYMIDGVLYLIKTSFLEKVMLSDDSNKTFWSGNFNCVLNEASFKDIDTMPI